MKRKEPSYLEETFGMSSIRKEIDRTSSLRKRQERGYKQIVN